MPDRRKILLVEDKFTTRALVKGLLKALPYDFVEAEDGAQGLRVARKERPELIISDVEMPNMSGLEMCRFLKNDPNLRAVPVVLLTSRTDERTREDARRVGASAYLNKPVQADALEEKIQELLPA
jgi:twitching motility two-component system response regulator PilG